MPTEGVVTIRDSSEEACGETQGSRRDFTPMFSFKVTVFGLGFWFGMVASDAL